MRLVNDMRENPDEPRVLIIDEMNRANLSKVLGEILFLLEYRDVEITLKSQSSMSLPKNLYIISTMNTADRNIRSIDLALRRRFRYFELAPSSEALRNFYNFGVNTNEIGVELFLGFEELNRDLSNQLDRHHTIGHSFFMVELLSKHTIQDIWQYQIFPLIEEYFFDRADIAQEFSLAKYFPNSAA
jgi:5-methylcytosine-specific restriction protein B